MSNALVTSVDVVRAAIADRIHELGGSDELVSEVALAACCAMWFTACSSTPSR